MANWIAGAIKHPGALHRELGVPQGQKIPQSKLAHAANAGGVLGRRARFAEELKGFHRANGGPVQAGQPYMVGEKGPEMFRPRQSGRITSHDALRSMLMAKLGGGSKSNC
jgi:phage-related minor tail protein